MAKENGGCELCRTADHKAIKALVARRQKLKVRAEDIARLMKVSANQLWRMESGTRRMAGRRFKDYESALEKLAMAVPG